MRDEAQGPSPHPAPSAFTRAQLDWLPWLEPLGVDALTPHQVESLVDAARVKTTEEGMVLTLSGRTLRVLDTPGHARHHHCLWDEASRGVFTGDTFGLSYREFDVAGKAWVFPTSTPVQFEPGPLRDSVNRIAALKPEKLYLTHFAAVRDVPRLQSLFQELLDGMVALARQVGGLAGTLNQALVHENERSGAAWTLEWLTLPQMLVSTGASLRLAQRLVEQIRIV